MPQVPVYRQQVGLGSLRSPGVAPLPGKGNTFGAGVRQLDDLGRGATALSDSMDRAAQRDATTEAFNAEAEIKKQWLDYSSQLQKNRQGVGAKGVTQEVEKWWAETAPKFAQGAKNGLSQRMIQQSAQRLQLAAMGQFSAFENQQLEVAADAAFQSNIDASVSAIAEEPGKAGLYRQGIEAALRQQATTKGWDEATYNRRRDLALQAASLSQYKGVLRTQGATGAQAFLDDPNNGLPPSMKDELTTKLKPILADEKAEAFAASVAGQPLDKQVEAAQKIEDADVRKAAVERIQQNEQLRSMAVRAREQAASDTIWQLVGQGTPMGRLPKDVLAQMDGKERAQVTEHYRAAFERAKKEAEGKPIKTDYGVYERLVNLPPEEFLQVRLSTFQNRLSTGDLEKLIDRQAKLRNPKEAGDVASTEQQMGTYATLLDLKGEKKGMFQQAAYNEFDQFRKVNKREPNYKERQEILDRLTMESDGGWFGGSYRLFEKPATAKEREKFVNDVVPEKERKDIIDALNQAGLPVTNENILDAYRRANPN